MHSCDSDSKSAGQKQSGVQGRETPLPGNDRGSRRNLFSVFGHSANNFEVDVAEFDRVVPQVVDGVEVDVVVAGFEAGGDEARCGNEAGGVGGDFEGAVAEETDVGEVGAASEDGVDRDVQWISVDWEWRVDNPLPVSPGAAGS